MFSSNENYDRGVNTFNPQGRLCQIEYAMKAIELGSTSLGVVTSEGVLLAAEKRVPSTLVDARSVQKILEIDSHIGTVVSGLVADARILVEHARVEAANHRFTYNEPIRVESCTLATCDLSLRFGEGGGRKALLSRPFGVALLIAGVDETGPQLWQTDPSGTYTRYEAMAIGAGADGAQSIFAEQYHTSMTMAEAEKLVISTLKQVMEDKIAKTNVEIACIKTNTKQFEIYPTEKIEALINSAE